VAPVFQCVCWGVNITFLTASSKLGSFVVRLDYVFYSTLVQEGRGGSTLNLKLKFVRTTQ